VAPFHIVVTPISLKDADALARAESIYQELAKSFEVLFDDRDERPGVKFKDADLIGVPLRIVVGPKGLAQGVVELFERVSQQKRDVPLEELRDEVERSAEALRAAEPR
jgi:prolyl-tRNA synthetase